MLNIGNHCNFFAPLVPRNYVYNMFEDEFILKLRIRIELRDYKYFLNYLLTRLLKTLFFYKLFSVFVWLHWQLFFFFLNQKSKLITKKIVFTISMYFYVKIFKNIRNRPNVPIFSFPINPSTTALVVWLFRTNGTKYCYDSIYSTRDLWPLKLKLHLFILCYCQLPLSPNPNLLNI